MSKIIIVVIIIIIWFDLIRLYRREKETEEIFDPLVNSKRWIRLFFFSHWKYRWSSSFLLFSFVRSSLLDQFSVNKKTRSSVTSFLRSFFLIIDRSIDVRNQLVKENFSFISTWTQFYKFHFWSSFDIRSIHSDRQSNWKVNVFKYPMSLVWISH